MSQEGMLANSIAKSSFTSRTVVLIDSLNPEYHLSQTLEGICQTVKAAEDLLKLCQDYDRTPLREAIGNAWVRYRQFAEEKKPGGAKGETIKVPTNRFGIEALKVLS
ncbi:hypothetical protein A2943_03365 [Candidatus Adlerbacteria bacterium RIFCSPLOWO2_01_FULL_51_16]|uniref:Uncharacterized protein n=1 Tax=Candidatus Adlerbacteria bacterium RIFCSPLOWO2_01_FULL_51_16 TaxID=1797243 RepID=A0A1F4XHB5_9BACT|nr:MAG: hypothetical protein A2943_03365 [Candidatus Adlerbacteria bacterium RIFCSPLOWO2_01_FULL_51_16]